MVGSGSLSLSLSDQNVNFDGYATSPYTITVGKERRRGRKIKERER